MDDNANTTPKLDKVIPEAVTVRPSFSGDNEDAEDIFNKSEAPDSTAICPLAATSTRMLLMIPCDRSRTIRWRLFVG